MIENGATRNKRQAAQTQIYRDVKTALATENVKEAEELLDIILLEKRDAEWYFLKGCALTHNGWFHDAQICFETANRLEPDNVEYTEAAKALNDSADKYSDTWKSKVQSDENSAKKRSDDSDRITKCRECCTECACECLCEGICGICDGI